jgi:vancomycin permeability regulator SanA
VQQEIIRQRQGIIWLREPTRLAWTVLALGALCIALVYLAVLLDVYRVAAEDSADAAPAAVVLGAAQWNGTPSPVFRARLDQAARLWHADRVRWVIVTGGTGAGDTQSEAEVGVHYLASQGVPLGSLYAAPGGSSTLVSLEAATDRLQRLRAERVLLVSDPYHMKRSLRMADDLGLTAEPAPVRDGPYSDAPLAVLHQSLRESAGFIAYLCCRL